MTSASHWTAVDSLEVVRPFRPFSLSSSRDQQHITQLELKLVRRQRMHVTTYYLPPASNRSNPVYYFDQRCLI